MPENDAAASIYVIEKPGNPAQITNVQVTNNVIGKGFYFWADVESTNPTWTNNIDYATGELVSDQNVLSPIIFGQRVQLSFLLIILATVVGGTLLGIGGAFLAVPAAAALQVLVTRIVAPAIRAANEQK